MNPTSLSTFLKHKSYNLRGEEVVFDFRKAIYRSDNKCLIISDLHIGKAGHFRKNGIAVPTGIHGDDLHRLESLIFDYNPESLLILGDLSHSKSNREWDHFCEWLEKYDNLSVELVPGNHDILSKNTYQEAGIEIQEEFISDDNFAFVHNSEQIQRINQLLFSGHVHPGIRLSGKGRQSVNLPCFYISDKQVILPAFSGFTGRFKISPKKGDEVLVITPKGFCSIKGTDD